MKMSTLRHARIWYVFGAALTLLVVVASLVPARDLPRLRVSDKLEHILAYLALALWFGGLVAPRRYLRLALGLIALGGGVEIAQGLMGLGREADWRDFEADALGVALGLSLCLAGLRHWAVWLEQWPKPR
jgi:VanZ family protein